MKKIFTSIIGLLLGVQIYGQHNNVYGKIYYEGEPLPYAQIEASPSMKGAVSDHNGDFEIQGLSKGTHMISVSFTGFRSEEKQIQIDSSGKDVYLEYHLEEKFEDFNPIVVTGTKTFKRKTESAVIVNVIDQKTLGNVNACNLAEGLRFQPGLRVETDCQTCNYTQLRMNGMGGAYSQILINGRPILSPLTGLYGLEQIPASMIDRIEVVRGGGSALYGSSAIGGTVNVITRLPEKDMYDINYSFQNINGQSNGHLLSGMVTKVNKQSNAGISIFTNYRNREFYDDNNDNFSELPRIKTYAIGGSAFLLPASNQKLEMSMSYLNEYRYGGEMISGDAYLAQQAEERTHHIWMGNLDYQVNFNGENSSFITYLATQNTNRDHFTGILPDDLAEATYYLSDPPYGTSNSSTIQVGVQLNHRINNFPGGANVFTFGSEYQQDNVFDEIEAYRYEVDQSVRTLGSFLQSDWELLPQLNLLSGFRAEKHNLVDRLIISPRFSLLYKFRENTQFRVSWSTGFRAPQAFDTDLHIAFAGGGVSRISLAENLKEERSQSLSASVNFDRATEHFVGGFTLEAFHTRLKDAFYLQNIGEDPFGELFEKQNGTGAQVSGATLELRANYDQKAQLEAGFTIQRSRFNEEVERLEGLSPGRRFLRTPDNYGYAVLSLYPNKFWSSTLNLVYTGSMELLHLSGAPEQVSDELVFSTNFVELSWKVTYTVNPKKSTNKFELFGGINNIFDAYQSDFDSGKNRDSNYVYGPALPRNFFLGLKFSS